MKNQIKTLAALGVLGASGAWLLRSRAAQWKRESDAMTEAVEVGATANSDLVSFRDFGDLPAPVAAYFRFALQDGQPRVRLATIRHEGQFSLNSKWVPFASVQHFSSVPSAFVWDAKLKMNALLNVRVRDSYVNGRGGMKVKMQALFPIMDAHDDTALDKGSLMRYLAELAWLPTALLPSENLKWTPIDDNRALATLTDGDTTVSLEFTFNERGEISEFFAPARVYATKGESKSFPWSGRLWNYQARNGVLIPLEGEVAWQMPEGRVPYYKGKMIEVEYS